MKCNLKVLLAERNLKITQVSNDTGISRTTLTFLSNGEAKGIQFSTLETLCNYLNITANELFIQNKHKNNKMENNDLYLISYTCVKNGVYEFGDIYKNGNEIKDIESLKNEIKLKDNSIYVAILNIINLSKI